MKKGSHFSPEQREQISQATKAAMQNPDLRGKLSAIWKRNWASPKIRERMLINLSLAHKRTWQNAEFRIRLSKIHKKLWQKPEYKKAMSRIMSKVAKETWQNPEYKQHQSKAQLKSWQNPEIAAKRLAGTKKHPNKLEQQLIGILESYFPQFKYNGDFSQGVMLGGLIPDFININGKKEVIELFGDYYHSPDRGWKRSELGKIMVYNSVGYHCLVIWEHDVKEKSGEEIANMIRSFTILK